MSKNCENSLSRWIYVCFIKRSDDPRWIGWRSYQFTNWIDLILSTSERHRYNMKPQYIISHIHTHTEPIWFATPLGRARPSPSQNWNKHLSAIRKLTKYHFFGTRERARVDLLLHPQTSRNFIPNETNKVRSVFAVPTKNIKDKVNI